MVVQPRLALLAALLVPVVLLFEDRPWIALGGVGAFVAALWLVDWLLAPSPSRIGIARELPTSITLGRVGSMSWLVRNGNGATASIRFSEALAPSLCADSRRAELRLGPDRSATVTTDLSPVRRGRFELGELVIRVAGPLGFAARAKAGYRRSFASYPGSRVGPRPSSGCGGIASTSACVRPDRGEADPSSISSVSSRSTTNSERSIGPQPRGLAERS